MTAITVMTGSVTAYTISPWNNTQTCRPRKDERNSLVDGASCPISNTTSTPDQCNGGKHNPTTPDTNNDNPSSHQRQKKHCHGVKVILLPKRKKDLGMFYSVMHPSTLRTFSPRTYLKSFAWISLAREKSVTMLIAILLTPGRLQNSNARLSSWLPTISSRKTWNGSSNIISWGCPTSQMGSKSFLVTPRVLPVRRLDLSDSYVAMWQICWITKTFAWLYPHLPD